MKKISKKIVSIYLILLFLFGGLGLGLGIILATNNSNSDFGGGANPKTSTEIMIIFDTNGGIGGTFMVIATIGQPMPSAIGPTREGTIL